MFSIDLRPACFYYNRTLFFLVRKNKKNMNTLLRREIFARMLRLENWFSLVLLYRTYFFFFQIYVFFLLFSSLLRLRSTLTPYFRCALWPYLVIRMCTVTLSTFRESVLVRERFFFKVISYLGRFWEIFMTKVFFLTGRW